MIQSERKNTNWIFDDLWEEGYRFNNNHYKCWIVIDRNEALNIKDALLFLLLNIEKLEGRIVYNK